MRDHPNICKSIHLPCQSGSTRMLGMLNESFSHFEE